MTKLASRKRVKRCVCPAAPATAKKPENAPPNVERFVDRTAAKVVPESSSAIRLVDDALVAASENKYEPW